MSSKKKPIDYLKLKMPRLVKVVPQNDGYDDKRPFKDAKAGLVLCLGEIDNMPGHVAVVTDDGKVHYGIHPENFREPTEDEI